MEDYRAETERTGSRPKRKRKSFGKVIGAILLGLVKTLFTLAVIGLLTLAIFYRTFMHYVDTVLEPEMDVDIGAFALKQSSVIYYPDTDSGRWVELTKLHGVENRTLIDYERIPDHVVKALISIEDERFYEHKGVDWKSTAGQVVNMLRGRNVRGASTITQQLIKNLTGENQVTIRRKILEIFRALRFHEKYSDREILETYFNLVYFGHNAYGIEAAAETYFGKNVSDLTVAEGAAIVGITQNPWQYDPLRSDWSREQNRDRQLTVLYKMNELGYLSDSEYKKVKDEKLVFVGDSDYVETFADSEEAEESAAEKNEELDSFFVEQVFRDVVDALMEKGYSKQAAQTLLYTGGYKIYCTMDLELQQIIEDVYANRSNFDYTSEKGEKLQSGMTIIDNYTHNIVAIAGRVGEREGAFEWSYAASLSQCGSAIKPLSVYAPAIDAGILTAASVIDDYPVYELNGSPYPVNAYTGYRGLLTIQDALRISSNTTAMRTLDMLTPAASFSFMEEKLGFTLDSNDLTSVGALALGGLTKGVSTVQMAAAYSVFASNGVYTEPRTFIEVRDSYGNVVLDNKQDSWVAMKESTVYTINSLLKNVMRSGGTGSAAAFSGMTMAGKTGTTNSRRDRYFVGYTPYYTAACWCGYPTPARINTNDNPAAIAWNKVMKRVHEGLPDKDFPTTSAGMVSVTVCNYTGLLAGADCGDTRTVYVAQGTAPTLVCDAHTSMDFCVESGMPAAEFCPEESRESQWLIDLTAPNAAAGFGYTREHILRPLTQEQYDRYAAMVEAGLLNEIPEGAPVYASDSGHMLADVMTYGVCTLHLTPAEEEPPEGEDPDNPENTGEEGEGGTEPFEIPLPTDPSGNDNATYLDQFLNLVDPEEEEEEKKDDNGDGSP
ncbi:MAG: transglycosylase domain-containing protein [Oscillospiraceae bacterium]|nr:transglycosylase domain-containing protein [Oscillospiraceae bacterium]